MSQFVELDNTQIRAIEAALKFALPASRADYSGRYNGIKPSDLLSSLEALQRKEQTEVEALRYEIDMLRGALEQILTCYKCRGMGIEFGRDATKWCDCRLAPAAHIGVQLPALVEKAPLDNEDW